MLKIQVVVLILTAISLSVFAAEEEEDIKDEMLPAFFQVEKEASEGRLEDTLIQRFETGEVDSSMARTRVIRGLIGSRGFYSISCRKIYSQETASIVFRGLQRTESSLYMTEPTFLSSSDVAEGQCAKLKAVMDIGEGESVKLTIKSKDEFSVLRIPKSK